MWNDHAFKPITSTRESRHNCQQAQQINIHSEQQWRHCTALQAAVLILNRDCGAARD
jgi:hypothetical protein